MKDESTLATDNKEIFVASALFDRKPGVEYLAEWESVLSQKKEEEKNQLMRPFLLFRLYREWLALPMHAVKDVVEMREVRTVPHKSGKVFRGVVNIGGQLKLCAALEYLLGIEPVKMASRKNAKFIYRRMIVAKLGREEWAFSVDEVHGIQLVDQNRLENVPVTVTKSAANYMEGIFNWGGIHVGVLQDELLFFSLRRSL